MANKSAAFQGGEWSELAYNSTVLFTGHRGGQVCSVLKPLQPDLRLIFHVCSPAKSPPSLKNAVCLQMQKSGPSKPLLGHGLNNLFVGLSFECYGVCRLLLFPNLL